MRVMILEPYPNIQGPLPRIVPLLSEALRQAGCEVVAERWGRHREQEDWREKTLGRIGDIRRIRAALARDRVDVLLVESSHDWKTVTRDLALLLATRGLRRAAVLQIHGSLLECIEGGGHAGFKAASRMLFRQCDGVVVSSQVERVALARFAPECRFFVAANVYAPEPAAPPAVVPAEWRLPADRPVIFHAARLIPEKGVRDLLAAMPAVLRAVPCHLLLAGVGPLEAEVQAAVSRPPLAGHVSWVRYLDRPHLELAYGRTDVFVLPTYHPEGLPAVIQDALGHGLPIVATPTRAIADHVRDGVNGRLVPARDPAKLAAALVELLSDPALRQRMSAANREKAKEFSSDKVAQQYLQILEQALRPAPGGSDSRG
jgi:glycosyltransferase involved in cell wall biosynthesis